VTLKVTTPVWTVCVENVKWNSVAPTFTVEALAAGFVIGAFFFGFPSSPLCCMGGR
jgi:hypothetical protein